jgi:hypothetical protein
MSRVPKTTISRYIPSVSAAVSASLKEYVAVHMRYMPIYAVDHEYDLNGSAFMPLDASGTGAQMLQRETSMLTILWEMERLNGGGVR